MKSANSPGLPLEHYFTINDPALKKDYGGLSKIPMQILHDAYFDGLVDFNGKLPAIRKIAPFLADTFTFPR